MGVGDDFTPFLARFRLPAGRVFCCDSGVRKTYLKSADGNKANKGVTGSF